MKTKNRLSIVVTLVVILGGIAQMVATGQRSDPAASIIGVWRESERTFTGPDAKTDTHRQRSVVIVTKSYYSIDMVLSDQPRPELSREATDRQKVDAYQSFLGLAGTYEINGDKLTLKHFVSMDPNLMRDGSVEVDTFRMEGHDTLWLTGKTDTVKLTRLE
jgi:hypothetical protein